MKDYSQIRKKTLISLFWSFIDLVGNQIVQFAIMIILARLLAPQHFGLLGMVMIFIALSQTLIDSGFSQALIREENVTKKDYSTVFWFNLAFSIIIYLLIFLIAPLISHFYLESELTLILRLLGLVVFFQAISIVPRTILTKNIDFKSQMKVSMVSSISSGIIAILLALYGFGVWALVFRVVIQKVIESLLLIIINKWVPLLQFSFKSFKTFYSFGWKLLVSGLIDTIYVNIYFVIIGKMYTKTDLGYYTNARQVRDAINQGITSSIQRVTYPVLSSIQSEDARLKYGFKKIIRVTGYIFFPIMLGVAAISSHLLILLLGTKWEPAILYFQLLCVAAILYPMHAINLNILKVKGRSDLFLKLEIFKKIITTVALIVTIVLNLGVTSFIVTAIITSHLALFINTYYSGREIDYGTKEQIKDLSPSYILSFFMGSIVLYAGNIINIDPIFTIVIQVLLGILIYAGVSKLFKFKEYGEIITLLSPTLIKLSKRLKEKT